MRYFKVSSKLSCKTSWSGWLLIYFAQICLQIFKFFPQIIMYHVLKSKAIEKKASLNQFILKNLVIFPLNCNINIFEKLTCKSSRYFYNLFRVKKFHLTALFNNLFQLLLLSLHTLFKMNSRECMVLIRSFSTLYSKLLF